MTTSFSQHDGPVLFSPSAPRSIEMAAEMLRDGGVVAIPTDTEYGVAGSLAHTDALDRIFALKQRDPGKPLPILVSSTDALVHLVPNLDPDVALLLDEYWPGPLTVAVPADSKLPRHVLAEDGTIGARQPNHRLAIELIERAGGAVACTSANLSGLDPATTANDVVTALGSKIDAVVDGGVSPGGVPSTVIGFAGGGIVVHREGAIAADHVIATWQRLTSG
ncbi:MAG: L-threonylcarbamoyladenylate synthase [Chloroflexota bacterium]|nr:L-threonylcarbamoyladenylate synthase [Chloroflexota bacterium]